ncbi:MAG: TonB-dependent receptor [Ferruginibacter sp.]
MKFTVALLFCATLHVSAKTYSQERITLKLESAELRSALKQIEKKSVYRFLYNDDVVSAHRKVSVNANNTPVTEVLDGMLKETPLAYKVLQNNLVVITQKDFILQEVKVTGKVRTASGDAIPAVTVKIKGSNAATATDATGAYSITTPDGSTLVFSSVGYITQEVPVNGRTEINVVLQVAAKDINEVVVIGYGTANKRDLTGSIAKVSGKDIADKPNTNPVASLQSKVAGLSIVNNGTPGKEPDIRIRGTISIGAVKPLYVVDGIFNDNIDYINPNDIESVEILKDPSSLAIFGVRGASGVIAITTKRARAGQTVINFNTSYGFKKLVDKIQMANAAQFQELYTEEAANIGVQVPFDYSKWPYDTDWIDAVTRTGHMSMSNLSIASSSEKNKFNFGLGYTNDEGIIRHEKLKKYLLSFSDEVKLSKNIKIGINFNGIRQDAPYSYAADVLSDARKVIPITPATTKDVYWKNPYGPDSLNQQMYYLLPSIQGSGVVNPLVKLENEWNKTIDVEYRMVASAFADITFLKNFNFRASYYGDISNKNVRQYTPLYYGYNNNDDNALLVNTTTSVREKDYSYKKFQQDYILNYKKSFGDNNLSLMGGWTTYYFGNFNRYGYVEQSQTGLPIPNNPRFWYLYNGFGLVSTQSSAVPSDTDPTQSEKSTASLIFRALYNYKGKYFLNGSFRRDGSSQISPNVRYQNFWAVGAAWELTQEDFMKNQTTFDFFKIKASIGVLGNQNTYTYDYPFYPGLTSSKVAIFANGNIFPASTQAYLPDRNLRWETVHSKEIGFEFDAFKRRLHFEVNYFNKQTKDLMTFIPGLNGAANGLSNIGSISNSGFEFSGNWNQKVNNDFTISVSGNLTTYKNKVLDLATKDFAIIDNDSRTMIGHPIGSFYGLIVDGIWQSYTEIRDSKVTYNLNGGNPSPGDFKYRDISGPKGIPDSVINAYDYSVIGNPTPDFAYGGTITLNYKNALDLSIDVGGVYGNEIFRDYGNKEATFQRVNYFAFKENRWHGAGTSNWEPIIAQDHRNNYLGSTYNIEDGSYFRIRNVQLGYNLPIKALNKAYIKRARVYVNVQNLKTYKHNTGYTPEFGGNATRFGVDGSGGAIPMITTFGCNVTF